MKLSLLLPLMLCSCTVARSDKGDYIATTARVGILKNGDRLSDGGIGMGLIGNSQTQRMIAESDSSSAGIINVGGPNGITLSRVSHGDPVKDAVEAIIDTAKLKAVERLGSDLIEGVIEVSE